MALADTARLIASLELQDKFSATAAKYEKTLGSMERRTSTAERVGFQIGRGARNTIDNLGRIGVVAAGAIATQVALGVRSLAQLQTITNQTDAVLESTRGAANVTADEIRKTAEALEDLTTVDDKAIQAGQNLLLTFTGIRNEVGKGNDIFNQATETLVDMAVALGTEPKQAAIQLGKALNDPIRGLTALRRVGVQFTEQQEKQIRAAVEAGDALKAQKIILAELNREFGKSGEAFGKGPAADMRRFGDAIEGAQQALATGFLPVISKVSKLIQQTLGDPKVQANIKTFGTNLAGGVEDLIDVALKLPWDAIGQSAKLMGTGAKALLDAFVGLPPWVQTAVLTGWGLNKLTGGALTSIFTTLAGGLVKGILNMNAGVVNIKAATVIGGGGAQLPGGGAGGRLPPTTFGGGTKLGGSFIRGAGLVGIAVMVADLLGVNPPGPTHTTTPKRLGADIPKGPVPVRVTNQPKPSPAGIERSPEKFAKLMGEYVGGNLAEAIADDPVPQQLRDLQRVQNELLTRGNIGRARGIQRQIDEILKLEGKVDQHRAVDEWIRRDQKSGLSAANRSLQHVTEGQRRVKEGIDAARERIGTGFQASNEKLGVIASKDFSPNVHVTVTSSTQVTIDSINRAQTSARIAVGRGPLETYHGE